jgi:ubiquinone/menaquinone biosynthesis C-methylase UbiE
MAQDRYWNHNVHYQPFILRAVPPRCGPALDVGCGDGMLAFRLAERCTEVTGIDRDTQMIALARERAEAHPGHVNFAEADFLAHPMPDASFDFVCANTSLHHMDFAAALTEMARVLRPGGSLAVIGLASNGSITDFVPELPAAPVNLFYRAVYHEGDSGAPVKDPDMTWSQVRATATALLPGVRYRRLLLWRYSLLWSKPSPNPRRQPGYPP